MIREFVSPHLEKSSCNSVYSDCNYRRCLFPCLFDTQNSPFLSPPTSIDTIDTAGSSPDIPDDLLSSGGFSPFFSVDPHAVQPIALAHSLSIEPSGTLTGSGSTESHARIRILGDSREQFTSSIDVTIESTQSHEEQTQRIEVQASEVDSETCLQLGEENPLDNRSKNREVRTHCTDTIEESRNIPEITADSGNNIADQCSGSPYVPTGKPSGDLQNEFEHAISATAEACHGNDRVGLHSPNTRRSSTVASPDFGWASPASQSSSQSSSSTLCRSNSGARKIRKRRSVVSHTRENHLRRRAEFTQTLMETELQNPSQNNAITEKLSLSTTPSSSSPNIHSADHRVSPSQKSIGANNASAKYWRNWNVTGMYALLEFIL